MSKRREAKVLRDIVQQETTMRKAIINILGALLITGSAVQMATASEHHMRKAYRAPVSASEQFRKANNSLDVQTIARTPSTEP